MCWWWYNNSSQDKPYCEQWWGCKGVECIEFGASKKQWRRIFDVPWRWSNKEQEYGNAWRVSWTRQEVPWTKQEGAHWVSLEQCMMGRKRYFKRGTQLLKSLNDLGMVLVWAHIVLVRAPWSRAKYDFYVLVDTWGASCLICHKVVLNVWGLYKVPKSDRNI